MAMSKYEKKLRRKYRPVINWAMDVGIIKKTRRYKVENDELFYEALEVLSEKIDTCIDDAAEDFPSQIFNPVYRAYGECQQEINDLCEYLEERIYKD